ncbi:MAG: hypothetical protein KKI04_00680 [Proteobacteria bacterium]|nr:hypothetical protein [Pseudomonadota bacterium]
MRAFFAKYRARAGWFLLVCLTGYAVLNLLWQSVRLYPGLPEKDPVTIHEERIRQLESLLPASGEVGYATTVENDRIFAAEKAFQNVEYLAQYVLTQYTLAPVIVRNSPEFPLVVGNFLDGPPSPGFLEKHGLAPLRDFGDGLVLYRRDRKK